MSNKFTYIIRSSSKSIPAENTNNCSMRLSSFLPSQYKYYDCKVAGFYIETDDLTFTTSIIELTVDGIDFVNGLDSKGGRLKTLAFTTLNNMFPQSDFTFRCSNFNGRTLRFQLLDDTNTLLTAAVGAGPVTNFNNPWILILNIEGVLE